MDDELHALAAEQGLDEAALRAAVDELRARAGAARFWVFWAAGGGSGGGAPRQRTLLAFPSPDAALAFAQRNQLGSAPEPPRLRALTLPQLLRAVLREPAIGALLLAAEFDELPAGRLPPGLRLERGELLRLVGGRAPTA